MTARSVRLVARGFAAAAIAALAVSFLAVPAQAVVPSVPVLTATPGNTQVTLDWTTGAGTGGAPTVWAVYRVTVSSAGVDGPATLVRTGLAGSTRSYLDTGRVNGTTYRYAVFAGNADGARQSNIVTTTPTAGGSTSTPTPTPTSTTTAPPPPPAAPGTPTLNAIVAGTSVNLSWAPGSGGAVAGWDLYRSSTSPVDTATATKIGGTFSAGTLSTTNSGLAVGTYYYVVVARNVTASTPSAERSATVVPPAAQPKLVMSNPDAVPGSDRFVMSRLGTALTPESMTRMLDPDNGDLGTPTWYRLHDVAIVHLENTGGADATITGLTTNNAQTFATSTALPVVVPAGGSVDIPVRFVYQGGTACSQQPAVFGPMVCRGTLTITAAGLPNLVAPLSGQWQPGPSREPGLTGTATCVRWAPVDQECRRPIFEAWLTQIVNGTFGFGTNVGSTTFLKSAAPSVRFGDEVNSKFWEQADPAQPITVRRLAVYGGAGLGAVRWYPASEATGCATSSTGGCQSILPSFNPSGRTAEVYNPATASISQGVLPLQIGDTAVKSFSPGVPFGLKMNSEYSDFTRNDITTPLSYGYCQTAANCGQHVRWFPVKNSAGQVVPNTYFVVNDLGGINLDYNDNVLLLTNIKPD